MSALSRPKALVEHIDKARAEALAGPRRFRSEVGGHNEILALAPEAFFSDFYWGGITPAYRTENGVAVIPVEGPLEHHMTWCWDSYERIIKCVEECMTGRDLFLAHERANWWREDYCPLDAGACVPAQAVILKIDSPGGEAAGTMAAHRALRDMQARYGIPLYCYADDMACSAAYALASGCREIWLPDTGVVGSIGVIATLYDRTAANKKDGLAVELITSGAYKADGHADRKITSGIRQRMQKRVDDIANLFWATVAEARGTTKEAIAALQAGTFLGSDAVEVGIADGVSDFPEFVKLVETAKMGQD